MKNVTVAKFELAFTRCRNNLKTVGNLPVKSSLQDFDAKEVCLNPKSRSVSFKKRLKMFYFHHFKVFTRCRFQNVPIRVPFSKPTVLKICRQKMCRFRVNRRPIRHIFCRFQNVPASCERSLSQRLINDSEFRCSFDATIKSVENLEKATSYPKNVLLNWI